MKKKLLFPSLLLAVLMLLTCVVTLGVGAAETMTMTEVAAGDKTPASGDVVTIATVDELKAFSAYVSAGNATKDITFKLDDSIGAEGLKIDMIDNNKKTNFNPIGGVYNESSSAAVAFLGTFDGNGKTVSGLIFGDRYYKVDGTYVSSGANSENLGFFALLGEGAVVKNLTLGVTNVENVAGPYFGVLASKAVGATVTGCTVNGAGTSYQLLNFGASFSAAGGLLGYAEDCVIDGCKANVMINSAAKGSAAGIVGFATDTEIRNCVVNGEYTHKSGKGYLGGIAAKLEGTSSVKNSYSSATVKSKATSATSVTSGDILGGIVGYVGADAVVENCFSDAVVTTKANAATGVLVGTNDGAVKNSYALRATADDGTTKAHADIGKDNGTVESVSAYQPKTEGDVTSFLLGTVVKSTAEAYCEACSGTGCGACGFSGVVKSTVYSFEADGSDVSLVDALNDWVTENATPDISYVFWAVSGSSIINCDHNAPPTYKAYAGQAPTCAATGVGDKFCSACNTLLEENATIPVDAKKHSPATYSCLAYECEYCLTTVPATTDHSIDGDKPCIDQICARCNTTVEATEAHTLPEGTILEHACSEFTCSRCGTEGAHLVDHDMPEVKAACQDDIVCEECGAEVPPAKPYHRAGLSATCTRNQICLDCKKVLRYATGHNYDGDPATCGAPQLCLDCDIELVPATGLHIYDRHADGKNGEKTPVADCVNNSVCVQCGYIGMAALGHSALNTTTSCGLGKACKRCSTVVEAASGNHIIDLNYATVIRLATATRSGIVEGICLDCGRKVEAYTTNVVMEKTGNVLISGGSFTFYTGSRVTATFGSVVDFQALEYEKGYIPLQVVTLALENIDGNAINISGGVTIKVALNKSAVQLALDNFMLYHVDGETLTEIAVSAVENGYLVFDSEMLGTFVLVADEDAAFEVLGTILPEQPQQTAALVGTASYERRDYEI